jgi:hypothetical protein
MSNNIYHNHHIIPKYRCKELGIDPDFDPLNIIRLTRLEHGQAHYERWLKHKDPRDLGAAQVLARGEIDGIPILSGENHPMWGKTHSAESKKKMSEAQKGNTYALGHTHSEETRKKISEGKIGKRGYLHSEETRKKMSKAKSGKNNPNYGSGSNHGGGWRKRKLI